MDVNYKILCEVKLLHQYYLTGRDGSTIFEKPLQADRLAYLRERFHFDYPSINIHLDYEPATPLKALFESHRVRVLPSYSGFRVYVSVKEVMLPGDIKAYRPAQALADDQPIIINLKSKDALLDTLTNNPIRKPLSNRYYFTNRNMGAAQQWPVLSRPEPLIADAAEEEQGELAFDPGDNKVKAFFFEKNGTKNWLPVKGSGFVNEGDRLLLPPRFSYGFNASDGITDAEFVLRDEGGTVISTITRTSAKPLRRTDLDYTSLLTTIINSDNNSLPGIHTLQVTSSTGYSKLHPILFCASSFLDGDTWGLIHLQPRVTDPRFQLIDNAGLLITRRHADGTVDPAPVFELRIKSRFAFWRYRNTRNEKILDNPGLHPLLNYDAANGFMETGQMVNASYTPIEFLNLGTPQPLPNPEADSPLKSELQRIYTDIRVPKSTMFKI